MRRIRASFNAVANALKYLGAVQNISIKIFEIHLLFAEIIYASSAISAPIKFAYNR